MADTVAKLSAEGADTWVATASPTAIAHLVPLSYAWNGACIVLAAEASSLTIRNIQASGRVRLGFGPTRDVVIVDGELERLIGVDDDAWDETGRAYAGQADWDPRLEPATYVFVFVRPRRVQAWREANELAGRVLMEHGAWLYPSREEAV